MLENCKRRNVCIFIYSLIYLLTIKETRYVLCSDAENTCSNDTLYNVKTKHIKENKCTDQTRLYNTLDRNYKQRQTIENVTNNQYIVNIIYFRSEERNLGIKSIFCLGFVRNATVTLCCGDACQKNNEKGIYVFEPETLVVLVEPTGTKSTENDYKNLEDIKNVAKINIYNVEFNNAITIETGYIKTQTTPSYNNAESKKSATSRESTLDQNKSVSCTSINSIIEVYTNIQEQCCYKDIRIINDNHEDRQSINVIGGRKHNYKNLIDGILFIYSSSCKTIHIKNFYIFCCDKEMKTDHHFLSKFFDIIKPKNDKLQTDILEHENTNNNLLPLQSNIPCSKFNAIGSFKYWYCGIYCKSALAQDSTSTSTNYIKSLSKTDAVERELSNIHTQNSTYNTLSSFQRICVNDSNITQPRLNDLQRNEHKFRTTSLYDISEIPYRNSDEKDNPIIMKIQKINTSNNNKINNDRRRPVSFSSFQNDNKSIYESTHTRASLSQNLSLENITPKQPGFDNIYSFTNKTELSNRRSITLSHSHSFNGSSTTTRTPNTIASSLQRTNSFKRMSRIMRDVKNDLSTISETNNGQKPETNVKPKNDKKRFSLW